MSERARALAERLEQANAEFIATVEGLSDEEWTSHCTAENCTVAALACHVGGGYRFQVGSLLKPIAEGVGIPPFTRDVIDKGNVDYLAKNAARPKTEAVATLREQGTRAATYVRGLTDEQLDRSGALPLFGGARFTAEGVVENVMIGHVSQHLASIREAVVHDT
jgi:hypothetical protein